MHMHVHFGEKSEKSGKSMVSDYFVGFKLIIQYLVLIVGINLGVIKHLYGSMGEKWDKRVLWCNFFLY